MGGEAPAGGWTLRVRTPAGRPPAPAARRPRAASADGHALDEEVEEPGVYRAEAPHAGPQATWIISNPIYLRS